MSRCRASPVRHSQYIPADRGVFMAQNREDVSWHKLFATTTGSVCRHDSGLTCNHSRSRSYTTMAADIEPQKLRVIILFAYDMSDKKRSPVSPFHRLSNPKSHMNPVIVTCNGLMDQRPASHISHACSMAKYVNPCPCVTQSTSQSSMPGSCSTPQSIKTPRQWKLRDV